MDTRQRDFDWHTLGTADGRQVTGRHIFGMPLVAGADGDLFDVVRRPDGRVALFALSTQGYLSATPEGLGAFGADIGANESFSIIDAGDGAVAFRTADGSRYVSAPAGEQMTLTADASAVGPNERFVLEKFDLSQLPAGGHGCCNAWTRPTDEPGLLWNDLTHEKIVEWAVIGMHRPEIQNEETRRLITFWSRAEFQNAAYRGLDDADYKDPWRGDVILPDLINPRNSICTWHDHFYHPERQKNYRGDNTSAVTEGRRYFNLSIQVAMRMLKLGGFDAPLALHDKAGHYLGLSLHFLTDLTQPMHAVNFTNVFGHDGGYPRSPVLWDKRHSTFEAHAEGEVQKGYFDNYDTRYPLGHADVQTGDVVDAAWFLHHTAVNQQRVFNTHLDSLLNSMGRTDRAWTQREAEPALTASLLLAPKAVARYLAYWAKCANHTWDHIDPGHYYRIEILDGSKWVCLHNGHYRQDTMNNGQDLMFFIFNADGTWSIGCRAYKNNLWLGYDGLGGHWIGENRSRVSTPPPTSRFRFVPNTAPGGADGIWIYEAQKDEPVTVNDLGFDWQKDYLIRWSGTKPERQLFKLRKMGRIPDQERAEIKALWPDFMVEPWYGRS